MTFFLEGREERETLGHRVYLFLHCDDHFVEGEG